MARQQAEQWESHRRRGRLATLGTLAGIAAAGALIETRAFPRASHAMAVDAISPPLRFTAPIFKRTIDFIRQHENPA